MNMPAWWISACMRSLKAGFRKKGETERAFLVNKAA